MTARQKAAQGMRQNADTGSLTLVAVIAWVGAQYGYELPPGMSELVAGWVTGLGMNIKGVL